jgi:hypothetical protein
MYDGGMDTDSKRNLAALTVFVGFGFAVAAIFSYTHGDRSRAIDFGISAAGICLVGCLWLARIHSTAPKEEPSEDDPDK